MYSLPAVSVVIPVRNEEQYLGACLRSLARQDYEPSRLEAIVVDGCSRDGTRSVVDQLASELPFPVHLLDNPDLTTAAGLNRGIRLAEGDVIIYVLGHGELAPDYVSRCVETLGRTGADAVGGPIETRGEGALGEAIAAALSSPFGVGGARFRYDRREQEVRTVAFAAYRADVFRRIGYFDEAQVGDEDGDFHSRLREAGGRIVLSPTIRAVYRPRTTLRGLAREYLAFGAAKARTLRRHPRQLRPYHLAPGALVAALAVTLMPGRGQDWAARPARLALALYAVANLTASFLAARRRRLQHPRYLPVAFGVIHLCYGLGSWLGALGLWRPGATGGGR